jgi:hypothetical protein
VNGEAAPQGGPDARRRQSSTPRTNGAETPAGGPEPAPARFARLLWRDGDVRELRVPRHDGRRTASGYFDDPAALAAAAAGFDGRANVYLSLNPVLPALLARAAGRVERNASSTTADADVARRAWLPIDIDPVRPAGISASEEEVGSARATARAVRAYLAELGWPEPIAAHTGNGFLLLYAIDLPNDEPARGLVNGVLAHLAERFDGPAVKIDRTMGNAARIIALVGTLKCKGDHTPERPHRRSALLRAPESVEPVSAANLAALAPAPSAEPVIRVGSRVPAGWVRERLAAAGIEYRERERGGIAWYGLRSCPAHPDDGAPWQCGVGEDRDGRAVGKCFHNRGAGWGWQQFRDALGLGGPTVGGTEPRGPAEARLIRASTIRPRRVAWAWRDRLPLGKLTILDGRPGLGKSTMALDLAARLSTGRRMPDGFDPGLGPRHVVLVSAEDGPADTIVPRLMAAGADLGRVSLLADLAIPDGLASLEADIGAVEAAFLVVDPLVAFVPPRVNLYRDQDARFALRPLAELAERTGCAVLGLRHVNKAAGAPAQDRGTGSVAIGGAARSNLIAGPDPDADGRFALASVKNNLGPRPPSLGYALAPALLDTPDGPLETLRVEWTGEVALDADDLVTGEKQGAASRFLTEFLADGPKSSAEVKAAAEAAGLSWSGAVRRASERLGVVKRPDGPVGKPGVVWRWSLPDAAPPHPLNTLNTHNTEAGVERPEHRVEHRVERIEQIESARASGRDTHQPAHALPVEPSSQKTVWSWDAPLCEVCGRRKRAVPERPGRFDCTFPHQREAAP